MSPDQKSPDPKTPLTGISGKESVFDKKLRELRTTGQFEKPNRKTLEYIKKPSAEFQIPSTDSKLHSYDTDEEFTEIERMAFIDEASGFYNSRTILTKLANELRRAARYHRKFSLMIIELDGLSEKEHLSQIARDMLFSSFCKTLKKNVREVDILGRFDENCLMIVCPETTLMDGIFEAERLRQVIAASHFKPVGHLVSATVSIGLASYPDHGGAPIEVLAAALDASIKAIEFGGNQVSVAEVSGNKVQDDGDQDFTPVKDEKAEFELKSPEFAEHQSALALPPADVSTTSILP